MTLFSAAAGYPGDMAEGHWKLMWQHEMAAVSEGFCPVHKIALEPLPAPVRRIAGHCSPCRRLWGANLDTGEVGWWLDSLPAYPDQFSVAIPDWMGSGREP